MGQAAPAQLEERLVGSSGQERLELLVELVRTQRRSKPERAVELGEQASELLARAPDGQLEYELSRSLSIAYRRLRDFATAVDHATRAVELARADDNRQQLANALTARGGLYGEASDYQRALESLHEALDLVTVLGAPEQISDLQGDVGSIYRRLGNYSQALEHYLAAYRAAEKSGDRASIGWSLNRLGILYRTLGQNKLALTSYREALAIFEQLKDTEAVGVVLNGLGNFYRRQGDLERALDYLNRSLAIDQETGDRTGVATRLHNIGFIHQNLGDLDQAHEHYRKALAIRREFDDLKGVANTLQHIATVHHERGQYPRAIATFEASLAIASRIQARDEIQDAYRDMAITYAAMGRYRQALAAGREHDRIAEEMFSNLNNQVITEMQARFAAERKAKEIELLKQQQAIDAGELRRQETLRQALILGLALLGLLVLLLVHRIRLPIRATRTIKLQNQELEQSLARLIESEQRYRQLFDDPSLAKLLVDTKDGEILAANDSAELLLAEAPDVARGPVPEWLEPILGQLTEREAAGLHDPWVTTVRLKTWTPRYFEAWASQLQLQRKAAALITLHNVTERRRLEEEALRREERERYICELETRKAEVEASSQEKERFAFTVSHELKTPLVTIRGFNGMVARDARAGRLQRIEQDMARIGTAARRMSELLDDLLSLSRVGRVTRESQEVDLRELAQQAAATLDLRGATLQIADDLPPAIGDPERLRELFRQLIDNATKFLGDQPQAKVEIAWRRQASETVITVRDNGIGISQDYQRRVFKVFEQLEPGVEGTGIGLALAERVVQVHGGRIWIESEGSGCGAMLCFTLQPANSDGAADIESHPADSCHRAQLAH
ncbi:MAG: tetratricopeptide repeat protein [Acidobacteriota bacterium]